MIDFKKLSLQQLEVLREQWYTKAAKDGIVEAVIQVFLMFGENLTTGTNQETSVKFEKDNFKMLGCVYNLYDDPALLKPKRLIKLQAFYQGRLVFDINQKIAIICIILQFWCLGFRLIFQSNIFTFFNWGFCSIALITLLVLPRFGNKKQEDLQ